MNDLRCIGCGAKIQTVDKTKVGFTPASSLEKAGKNETEIIYCQRCFKLKNYNEVMDTDLTSDDFLKILQQIADTDALVVNIVDIFDFSGSIVTGLQRHIGGNDLIIAANKFDLLPKSVNKRKISHWMQRELNDIGMNPLDVALISAVKGHGIDVLMTMIEKHRKGRNVYIVGCTNVGKSTLINRIIKQFTDAKENIITTSSIPGTTLDMIEIALDDKSSLIDTPGIINEHQLVHYIKPVELKIISPKKEIKPNVYQLNPEQTLFVGGVARIDFVKGNRCSFVTHFSNDLKIHRTKLENANSLWERHAGDMLNPIIASNDEPNELKKHVYHIKNKKTDIVISGLGFITLPGESQEVHVYVADNVGVFLRDSIF